MKGLVLSGGKGTRLRPITHTSAKQLIPIANKPVLFYVIEALKEAGIKDIGVIVGDTKNEVEEALADGSSFGVSITYIEQEAPLGLAHAVKIARPFLKDEEFVMFLGDNLIKNGIKGFVEEFQKEKPNSLILLSKVKDPQRFGVAQLEGDKIVKLVEKPKEPPSNLALVGVYLFDKNIFKAVGNIKPSWRGELEITDAIQYLIDQGYTVKPHIVKGWWKDTGKLEDILEANQIMLEDIEPVILGKVDKKTKITGRVIVQEGAELKNSVVRGPAIIGEKSQITNSYIGPFTSIYFETNIEGSEIENSVILENVTIKNIPRIENSLIGRGAHICRCDSLPKAYRMMLGDQSQLEIP